MSRPSDQAPTGRTNRILVRLREALADRYRVTRELGRGAMATVFLADNLETGDQVAIKVLRPELAVALGPTRFHREIEILTRLRHPQIVQMLDSGEAKQLLYLVMPYVAGENLRSRQQRDGPLPLPAVLSIAGDIAEAIDHAHLEGILHRDIKPENVLLVGDRALVCDFGLARALDRAAVEPLSSSGLVLGTPAYMSPEQAMGLPEITGACDVYALGCVIFEMLTGELPFTGPTAQAVIARHLLEPPRSIRVVRPDLTERVDAAVVAALSKEPEARPGSGGELVRRLAG
jgi:eukaryotic-like serine/threonine-protein kinase